MTSPGLKLASSEVIKLKRYPEHKFPRRWASCQGMFIYLLLGNSLLNKPKLGNSLVTQATALVKESAQAQLGTGMVECLSFSNRVFWF